LSMMIGLLACYICGTLWFCFIYGPGGEVSGILTAVGMCVLPFIIPDLLKIWLAIFLNNKINHALKGLKS
ncbi:MAG: biotin transporter BioY, partial [Agathobacter sp.]|nr:biotin transporter BioY [Agathobacter sp.]